MLALDHLLSVFVVFCFCFCLVAVLFVWFLLASIYIQDYLHISFMLVGYFLMLVH